ncbi:acetate/propionate family kinase [Candidatus Protochlamydia phocaeensis]|uniref:acetate/propionate family kinase n=1 Tax=Candidatus Protochlamydia phocaeensis TaxID=1414722 RepID=UPI0008394968|nr:acetate kinase [Candidatus Protochlamydia phocaeensis]
MKILVVNVGSSSHKLSLFDLKGEELADPLWKGSLDWGRGQKSRFFSIQRQKEEKITRSLEAKDLQEGLRCLIKSLWSGPTQVIEGLSEIERIGHRVVHGGALFQQPVRVNAEVKAHIRQLIPLAPLHNPANLEGIELMEKFFPEAVQIAVFDTAFHTSMPDVVKTYPLPYSWKEKGVQRYGFHGISHQYCAERIASFLGREASSLKIINCHLGNGASLCAISKGKSQDTTMGLTPLEGLMMGSRCGSIDPGILLYAMREQGMSPQELDHILNFESGLKGITGSSDMREILAKNSERAQLALQMYIYRLKAFIGAYMASLGGIDVLSFTGGVGENAAYIRSGACRGLSCFGIQIDEQKNLNCQPDQDISAEGASIRTLVIHTQEEWKIAQACRLL